MHQYHASFLAQPCIVTVCHYTYLVDLLPAMINHMKIISDTDSCRLAVVLSQMSDLIEKHMGGTSGAVSFRNPTYGTFHLEDFQNKRQNMCCV